jgi:glycosyltransferase involved in cell wall biosynthesis
MNRPHLSVVSPVYGCARSLPELCERLQTVLSSLTPDYEIILINDGSPDESWSIIQQLAAADERIKGINLSRNFGQHYAITAGLDFSKGDWTVVMDCDLQDRPEEIPKLYEKARSGFEIVVGLRAERKDHWVKKGLSRLFYRMFAYFSGTKVNNRIGNFGIYSHKVIRSIGCLKEQNRAFGLFAIWVGFRRAEVDINHAARPYGRSGYTFRKMAKLALDSIIAHSEKLLLLTIKLGLTVSALSFFYAAWIVLSYLLWATPIVGWTSLIVSVYFTAGLIIGTIGIVGLYVGKIFDEVKQRPLYIIDSLTFDQTNEND